MRLTLLRALGVVGALIAATALDGGAGPGLALGVAAVALLILTLHAVPSLCAAVAIRRVHPRAEIDPCTLLAQSDPDAAGHPRPRAPGVAAPAA